MILNTYKSNSIIIYKLNVYNDISLQNKLNIFNVKKFFNKEIIKYFNYLLLFTIIEQREKFKIVIIIFNFTIIIISSVNHLY